MRILAIVDANGNVVFKRENVVETEFDAHIVEVSEGKYLKEFQIVDGVYTPVFADIPPSEINVLKQRVLATDELVLSLIESMYL